jgi:hypothetical protein
MDGNGSSYNPMNFVYISPILGLLTQLENRRIIRERNVSIPHIGNILIPIDTYLVHDFTFLIWITRFELGIAL